MTCRIAYILALIVLPSAAGVTLLLLLLLSFIPLFLLLLLLHFIPLLFLLLLFVDDLGEVHSD